MIVLCSTMESESLLDAIVQKVKPSKFIIESTRFNGQMAERSKAPA
jgi:hypothetical protein